LTQNFHDEEYDSLITILQLDTFKVTADK